MAFGEGILVALFIISMVFALLASIYVLIRITSAIITRLEGAKKIGNA